MAATSDPARSRAAMALGRGAVALSQRLGRGSGTMIGGRVALRVDPELLSTLGGGRRSVLITGTNGKSTVTALVAAALQSSGSVVCNWTGANMPDGIVTALAGDRESPLAAIEVDEAYLPPVVEGLAPKAVIALNCFREYTRGISLGATLRHWRNAAAKLPRDCTVVVNVDDPLVVWAFESAPNVVGVEGGLNWREDAALCVECDSPHEWEGAVWRCTGCARRRPEPAWRVAGPGDGGSWLIAHPGGQASVEVQVPGRTGPVGAAFALAASSALGVDVDAAARRISGVADVDGRYVPFPVGSRQARLLMLKNPAGWAEAIDLVVAEGLPLVLAVEPFGPKDTTTMWEAPFERLRGRRIPVTGARAADALAVLESAGVEGFEVADVRAAIEQVHSAGSETSEVVVACNYPAFRRLSKKLRAETA